MAEKTTDTEKKTAGKDWPSSPRSRDELDQMIDAGLRSGRSKRTPEEVIAAAKKRHGLS